MSDFIYSSNKNDERFIIDSFKKLPYPYKEIQIARGNFGIIGYTESLYNGFKVINNEKFLFITLGGPLLKFTENSHIIHKFSDDANNKIKKRWIDEEKMDFINDIDSPFFFFYIDKINNTIKCVSDLFGFIPILYANNDRNLRISSLQSKEFWTQSYQFDKASIVDFIINGNITYPYSIYQKVKQISPATCFFFKLSETNIYEEKVQYWQPKEIHTHTLSESANIIQKEFKSFFKRLLVPHSKICSFISAGEDSRLIATMLPEETHTITMIDYDNRELHLAQSVANKLKLKHFTYYRDKDYYLKQLNDTTSYIGIGDEVVHCHMYTMSKQLNLNKYDIIIDGLQADVYLKGYYITRKTKSKILNIIPTKEKIASQEESNIHSSIFDSDIIQQINERRIYFNSCIKKIRPQSYQEWMKIWPAVMDSVATYSINRRLFPVYMPFMSNGILIEMSQMPQSFKLNRLVFQKAFKKEYDKVGFIPHHNGSYPQLGWRINHILIYKEKVIKRISQLFQDTNKYNGSWQDWNEILKQSSLQNQIDNAYTILSDSIGILIQNKITPDWTNLMKRRLLQVGSFLKN
mgnify:CR=1 FL=1